MEKKDINQEDDFIPVEIIAYDRGGISLAKDINLPLFRVNGFWQTSIARYTKKSISNANS